MANLSISFKTGVRKTNIRHNNRALSEKEFKEPEHSHIIRELSQNNIIIRQEPLQDVYEREFGQALENYNAKQKRADRQIKDYKTHVKKSQTLDLQREFVVALGSKEDWDELGEEKKQEAGESLAKYVKDFEKRHPQLKIYNAVVHLDEKGAPHAHINLVPVAEGYKNGLERQPSFSKALRQEGNLERGRGQYRAFREQEVKELEKILNELGHERKIVGTNDVESIHRYKEVMSIIAEKENRVHELDQLIDDYNPIKEGVEELKQERYVLQKDLKELKQDLEISELKSEDLNLEIEQTTGKLSERQEELKQIESDISKADELKKEALSWAKTYDLDDLPSDKDVQEISQYFHQAKKIPLTESSKIPTNALNKIRDFIGPVSYKIKALAGKVENLVAENKTLKDTISNLKSEITTLKSAVFTKQTEFDTKINHANNRIKSLQEKNEKLNSDSKLLNRIFNVLDDDEKGMIAERLTPPKKERAESKDRKR
ncbi:MAG: plasmid recombination protein [Streptococcus parauberis]